MKAKISGISKQYTVLYDGDAMVAGIHLLRIQINNMHVHNMWQVGQKNFQSWFVFPTNHTIMIIVSKP